MAQADRQPKLNAARNAFEGAGVLMLEDLDLWMSPMVESAGDDLGGFTTVPGSTDLGRCTHRGADIHLDLYDQTATDMAPKGGDPQVPLSCWKTSDL